MRQLILKLDDIGREAHRAIFDTVLWSMDKKLPISIGTIGNTLSQIPIEVIEVIKLGIKLGFVEIWNHGNGHIRYDLNELDVAIADLRDGHQAIIDIFGFEPNGFGFPFNKFTPQLAANIRNIYPDYFIYETDFSNFKLISPEYNSLADGQPRFDYFIGRVGAGANIPNGVILQAHPPRWSNIGFSAFKQCVELLVEQYKFSCIKASDVGDCEKGLDDQSSLTIYPSLYPNDVQKLSCLWEGSSAELNKKLSNFKSYFLPRFIADVEKNYIQVSRTIYPFKPKNILDVGCGLGNWSLPFLLAKSCNSLVLNDINPIIMQALAMMSPIIENSNNLILDSRDLLKIPNDHDYKVDFLVCANTFNYLDPVDFFRFAQSATVPGARLLLMYQTAAFNKLRFRSAVDSKDPAVLSEVLSSDLAMLMRRNYCIYPTQVRHVFSTDEISKLAVMFDFVVESNFMPSGETVIDGESVYECLLLRRTTGMKNLILAREEWFSECNEFVDHTFGSKAFNAAGFPNFIEEKSFSYYEEWDVSDCVPIAEAKFLKNIKMSIDLIKQRQAIDLAPEHTTSQQLKLFYEKVIYASKLTLNL